MIVYIMAFAISIILIWLSKHKIKSQKYKKLFLVLAVLPLFIISAIRYNVGQDYIKRYTNDYIALANGKDVTNLEIGFKIIDYICLIFTKEPYLLFVITSLIIIAIIYQAIYKKSTNKILSLTIFFLGGYFFGTLNLVRQYIAVAFILLGYQFLLSDNKIKEYIGFIVCAIIAFLMHSSSIVCFILMFLNKKVVVNVKWVVPVSLIVLVLNENIMKIITPIIEKTRFNVYLVGKFSGGEVSILNIGMNLIVYLWMYIVYMINKKQDMKLEKEGILFLNIQGMALLITIAGTIHMQFSRIAIYFCAFQILSIPYYLSIMPLNYIKFQISKILKRNIAEKTLKIVTYTSVVICFLVMFGYTNILNNDNGVLPYRTIFSIEKVKES